MKGHLKFLWYWHVKRPWENFWRDFLKTLFTKGPFWMYQTRKVVQRRMKKLQEICRSASSAEIEWREQRDRVLLTRFLEEEIKRVVGSKS